MRLRAVAWATAVAALAFAPAAFAAKPHAEADSQVGTTTVHQEITVWDDGTIHYWIHAADPASVAPFCVTLALERKTKNGWRGIGMKNQRRGDQACCPEPEEDCFPTPTDGYWDLFVYPRGKISDKVQDGRLRMRGSTDLGPSLVLRLNGPSS